MEKLNIIHAVLFRALYIKLVSHIHGTVGCILTGPGAVRIHYNYPSHQA